MTLELGQFIDEQLNRRAIVLSEWLKEHTFPGLRDIIVAYSSVTVFYDPVQTGIRQPSLQGSIYNYVKGLLEEAWLATEAPSTDPDPSLYFEKELIRIPVCYGQTYGPDLERLSKVKRMTHEDIIELHISPVYRVYMIGFLPGFPYLGKVDPRLETSRKPQPASVVAGGVGIAGNQTGIYPVNSPGGWHIIGRTPIRLFDMDAKPPVRLAIGDRVQFYPVGPEEFRALCPV